MCKTMQVIVDREREDAEVAKGKRIALNLWKNGEHDLDKDRPDHRTFVRTGAGSNYRTVFCIRNLPQSTLHSRVRGAFCQSAKKFAAALAQSPKIGEFNKKS